MRLFNSARQYFAELSYRTILGTASFVFSLGHELWVFDPRSSDIVNANVIVAMLCTIGGAVVMGNVVGGWMDNHQPNNNEEEERRPFNPI